MHRPTMTYASLTLADGLQCYRESGRGLAIVLLHGISSCAASWEPLSEHLPGYRLLAWDAPGYGDSQPLVSEYPVAADYARRLAEWLEALGVERCVMVGHSLGAIIASAFVAAYPERVTGVILADPAQGYRDAADDKREAVYRARWTQLAEQGHAAYAVSRAPRLLRDDAREDDISRVRDGMRRLNIAGFTQASWMLANDALVRYATDSVRMPLMVLCGDEDRITPPAGAQALATRLGAAYRGLPQAGHASYIDAPEAFARAVEKFASGLVADDERTQP